MQREMNRPTRMQGDTHREKETEKKGGDTARKQSKDTNTD